MDDSNRAILDCINAAAEKHIKEIRKRCFDYDIQHVQNLPIQLIRTGLGKPVHPGNQDDLYLDLSPDGCTYIYDKFFDGWVEMINDSAITNHPRYKVLNYFYLGEKEL